MKKILIIIAAMVSALSVYAQDCEVFIPLKKGTVLGYTYYNKPGVVESSAKTVITETSNLPGGVKVRLNTEVFDKSNQSKMNYDYDMWCENGVFYVDMMNMLSSMDVKDPKGFQIESNNMQFPSKMSPGQVLSDASLSMKMGAGIVAMGITVNITNRRVEAIESITTPAGTFECYKISYDTSSKILMMKIQTKVTEWYAKNVGLVRSESYDKKGKLTNIAELTLLK
jgi:hypothetical protein